MDFELLLEAERRGILPPDKAALLAEARKRGLAPAASGAAPAQKAPKGPKSWRDQWLPDDDPDSFNRGEKMAAMLNKAGEAMTLGVVGDEADARVKSWLPGGGTYDEELVKNRDREAQFQKQHPGLSLGAAISGALAPVVLSRGKLGVNPAALGTGLGRRMGLGAGLAGSAGGVYGFMEGEGGFDERVDNAQGGALLGGGMGVAAPLAGAAVQKALDTRAGSKFLRGIRQTAPMADDIFEEGRGLYRDIDNAGLSFRPDYVKNNADDILRYLRSEGSEMAAGLDDMPAARFAKASGTDLADRAAARAAKPDAPPITFEELRRLQSNTSRRAAQSAAAGRAYDAQVSGRVADMLGDTVDRATNRDIDGGDLKAVQGLLPKAKEVWARAHKTRLLETAIEEADNRLSNKSSGLKNAFKRLLANKSTKDKFTAAEKEVMRKVIHGGRSADFIDNMGGGLGTVAQTTAGGAIGVGVGGPLGAIAGMAAGAVPSAITRGISEAATTKRADIARALIASGKAGVPLPVASDQSRRVVEALLRRSAVAGAD